MTQVTSLEKGLARLLRICPDLTLNANAIQLIIDGKQNEVIGKHRGTWVEPKITGSIAIDTQEEKSELSFKDLLTEEEKIKDDNKSFDEYFKD